jgi:hypothetical protein
VAPPPRPFPQPSRCKGIPPGSLPRGGPPIRSQNTPIPHGTSVLKKRHSDGPLKEGNSGRRPDCHLGIACPACDEPSPSCCPPLPQRLSGSTLAEPTRCHAMPPAMPRHLTHEPQLHSGALPPISSSSQYSPDYPAPSIAVISLPSNSRMESFNISILGIHPATRNRCIGKHPILSPRARHVYAGHQPC